MKKKKESLKIRVAGTKEQVELLTEQLRNWSKQWGKRKIFRVKRYDRGHDPSKYHRTFGARRYVNYIDVKLPKDPRHPVCMIYGHSGDKYCGRCGAKMPEDPQQISMCPMNECSECLMNKCPIRKFLGSGANK